MPHKLKDLLARVPSDIDIAQAATPIPIDKIAAETAFSTKNSSSMAKAKPR